MNSDAILIFMHINIVLGGMPIIPSLYYQKYGIRLLK